MGSRICKLFFRFLVKSCSLHTLPLLVKETGFIIDLLLNTPGGGADKKSPGSLVMEIRTIVMLEAGECYSALCLLVLKWFSVRAARRCGDDVVWCSQGDRL